MLTCQPVCAFPSYIPGNPKSLSVTHHKVRFLNTICPRGAGLPGEVTGGAWNPLVQGNIQRELRPAQKDLNSAVHSSSMFMPPTGNSQKSPRRCEMNILRCSPVTQVQTRQDNPLFTSVWNHLPGHQVPPGSPWD